MPVRTRRRTRYLAWAPPTLVSPTIIDYTDSGPYDVTADVQRPQGYQFSNAVDLVVRLPRGWDYNGYGTNTRQSAPIRRSGGVWIYGGRNIVVPGGEIDVAENYVAQAGETFGTPNYPANRHLVALVLQQPGAGTIHVEGIKISGAWLYEAIDLIDGGTRDTQLCNILIDAVPGPDGQTAGVRYYPELTPGATGDHDGGDVLQTKTSRRHVRIDGLHARSCWFQGLFFKRESTANFTGVTDVRNVFLEDYQGPGAAFYLNNNADGTPIAAQVRNVWVEMGRQRVSNGTGATQLLASSRAIETAVYQSGAVVGSAGAATDGEGAYATGAVYLDDTGATGGKIRAGRPPMRVLSGTPGQGYVSPGYLTTNTAVLRIPGI